MGLQLHAEDIPQVLLPVGLLVPEDTQANTLGGETQHANSLIMGGVPQVYIIYLSDRREMDTGHSCI